ncbi:hypothetical protein [Spirillospora sp. CA-294931]|uniref:hypothetical protein n=1 Tax=Spirillospora sp. CA-294931 TaxID=3240042 RepID=UPI003D8FADFD
MTSLISMALSLWLLWFLIRLPFLTQRRRRVRVRFRVPLRHQYPRASRAATVFVLFVVTPVVAVASSCGWWGL